MKTGEVYKSSTKVYEPAKGNEIVADTVKPDTLQLIDHEVIEEVIEQAEDKIKDEKSEVKRNSYKIDILIPMDSYSVVGNLDDIEQGPANSMLHYYSGMIMALVELKEKGANLDVNVYDAPSDKDRTEDYLKGAKKNKPDLIIGPNDKDQLKRINKFSADNGITVITPWKALPNSANENSAYVQLKPSLESYYERITGDIDLSYSANDVFMVGFDDGQGRSRLKNINAIHLKLSQNPVDYNTILISQVKLESDYPVFQQIFTGASKKKIIILPNWSFKDEDFLFACLRKINLEKGTYQVEVYGMPIMLNSDKLSYDLFKSLNIRIVSPNFLDDTDYVVREFKTDFYKQFNVFPNAEAYEGYDMMSFVVLNMLEHGRSFYDAIQDQEIDMQTTSYKLVKKLPEGDYSEENKTVQPYYENKRLYIIGFENNKFVKLR